MKCSKCGKGISKKFKLCPNCGTKVEIKKEVHKVNKKLTFIVSGVLLLSLVVLYFILFNSKADFDDLKKSVVLINVYDSNNELNSTGSGVVAFENDIILTNAHVIEDNYKIEVISENNTKYQVDGVLDYNKKKDIAILKLTSSKGLKKVKIGKKVKSGSEVTAIGSPLGLKNTISTGIISAMFQDNIEVYQHTAPISPGSSGGALFNSKGELIGITYASLTAGQNLNLAIPISFFEGDYNKVKSNDVIDTQYYYLLNSQIMRTKSGVDLIQYMLNDKYSNTKQKRVEIEEEYRNGHLYYDYTKWDNDEIGKYIVSTVNLMSGLSDSIEWVRETDNYKENEGTYYDIYILKLTKADKNIIKKVKKYINENLFSPNTMETGRYSIESKENYIYALECRNYDDCSTVKKLVEAIVKQ